MHHHKNIIIKARSNVRTELYIVPIISRPSADSVSGKTLNTIEFKVEQRNGGFHQPIEHSRNILTKILLNFMRNFGTFVVGFVGLQQYNNTESSVLAARAAFHKALIDQIHSLIGQVPTIKLQDGKYAIYLD